MNKTPITDAVHHSGAGKPWSELYAEMRELAGNFERELAQVSATCGELGVSVAELTKERDDALGKEKP